MNQSPLYAAIDLGSNSFHMLVVREVAGAIRTVAKVKRKVRLAAGLDADSRLSLEAMERGWDCLRLFAEQLQDVPKENTRIVGTATLRLAANVDDFLIEAERILGHHIEVITGEDEAKTIYQGVSWTSSGDGKRLVIDIGGGSLEVAMGSDEDPTVALSVPAGAGRVTREFLPENGIANDRDLEDARRNIRKILEPMVKAFPKSKHPMHAVGTSKTIRSLARLAGAVVRQPGRVDTSIMTIDQLEDWLPRLAAISPDQRTALPGVTPERTYQIVGGGLVIDEIMKALDVKEVEICPWALREGAILRWLDQFGRTRLGF